VLWSNSSNLWGLASYADDDADSDGNGPGFEADGFEFQAGYNTSLGENTRFGVSLGYGQTDVDDDAGLLSGEVETISAGLGLRHDFAGFYLGGQVSYSWHNVDSTRVLLLGGNATASFDASTWYASGEAGARFETGQLSVEPHVSVRHASTDQDSYSEAGPVGVLNVTAEDYETTRLGVGVRLVNRHPEANVRPYALLRYERELGDERALLDNELPGLPAFRVTSTDLGENIFTARLGIEAQVTQAVSLFASGSGRWRSNESSLSAQAGVRIRF
jgi:subtilase-type serine protease